MKQILIILILATQMAGQNHDTSFLYNKKPLLKCFFVEGEDDKLTIQNSSDNDIFFNLENNNNAVVFEKSDTSIVYIGQDINALQDISFFTLHRVSPGKTINFKVSSNKKSKKIKISVVPANNKSVLKAKKIYKIKNPDYFRDKLTFTWNL
jgi:hypothetical protein